MTEVTVSLPDPVPGKSWKVTAQRPVGPEGHQVDFGQQVPYDRVISGEWPDGFTIPPGERWYLDGRADVWENIVNYGTLVRDRAGSVLRWHGIDEAQVVGGGDDPLPTDHGLWVMGDGKLEVTGTDNRPRWAFGVHPSWTPQDELWLAPWNRDLLRTGTYTPYSLGDPVPDIVPGVPAIIERRNTDLFMLGEPTGRPHVFIRSTQPQTITGVGLEHVGQRKGIGTNSEIAMGRYPMHFHHCEEGSRGSTVSVTIKHSGNRGIVPHMSHGVHVYNSLGSDIQEDFLWYDPGPGTNDLTYEANLGSGAHSNPGYSLAGMLLGEGTGNRAFGNFMIRVGGKRTSAGSLWRSGVEGLGVWGFHDNGDLGCLHGINVWQNNNRPHLVENHSIYFPSYAGIRAGAYRNSYRFRGIRIYGAPIGIEQHATAGHNVEPDGYSLSFRDFTMYDTPVAVRTVNHNLPSDRPVLYKDMKLIRSGGFEIKCATNRGLYDLVNVTRDGAALQPSDIVYAPKAGKHDGVAVAQVPSVVRVQNGSQAFRVDLGGVITIPLFYP